MRNYELTLIFSPLLSETDITGKLEGMINLLQEAGGILEKQARLGRKLLPGTQDSAEGELAALSFLVAPEHAPVLAERLRTDKDVVRFLLAARKQPRERPVPAFTPGQQAVHARERTPEEVAAENQSIDERLAELFKEEV